MTDSTTRYRHKGLNLAYPPAEARRMADGISGAELEVILGAGHLPPLERPSRTRAAMVRFLAQV